jgi:putative aldouronate transport system substrate-binding protein
MFADHPNVEKKSRMTDGNIYSLPEINDCFHTYMPQRMWMNQVWLDNLGLSVPTTTDELYDVLVAFRDQDANGNGDPNDEVPMAGAINGWYSAPDWFIMNAFTYYNIANMQGQLSNNGLFLDGDTVVNSFSDPAFKEGLSYLNKLYSEGLLYNASYNQTHDQLTQLAENPDANLLGSATAGYVSFATMGGERYGEYTEVLPLTGPNGFKNVVCDPYVPYYNGEFSINKDCAYPEIAIKWADLLYSEEATLRSYYGPQGEAWDWAQEGDIGLDGKPALYRQLIPWQETEPQSLHLVQQIPDYRSSRIRLGLADDTTQDIKSAARLETWLQQVAEAYHQSATPEKKLPPVKFTVEEGDDMMIAMTEINSTLMEAITGFINGTLSVENDYDQFLIDLENKGLPLLTEYYQKAYDAQWK